MEQFFAQLKDYIAIVVACLAAAVSLVNLVLTTKLTERRERRKTLWERELARFSELEDIAGRLVEDLLSFNKQEDSESKNSYEKLQYIRQATGRFLRYDKVARALRDFEHAAGWYISQKNNYVTSEEYKEARNDVSASFKALIMSCDEALKNAPNGL